jgi:hypothetical protein
MLQRNGLPMRYRAAINLPSVALFAFCVRGRDIVQGKGFRDRQPTFPALPVSSNSSG